MNQDFEKTLALLAGEDISVMEINKLSEVDRTQISNAIDLIFQGLSLQNWLAGGTLSEAWNTALDQLREYVFSIPVQNPATKFAHRATFDLRMTWQEKMRTAPHTNMPIQCPADQRADWQENAERKIQNGVDLLAHVIKNFAPGTPKQPPKQTITQTLTNEQIKQKYMERENQRVRERELPH